MVEDFIGFKVKADDTDGPLGWYCVWLGLGEVEDVRASHSLDLIAAFREAKDVKASHALGLIAALREANKGDGMILQFLTAYAELVAELTRVGGPQHHDLTGDLETDVRNVAGWLHHLELNLQHYAENRPEVHVAVVALIDAWKAWNDTAAARQALWELFLNSVGLYARLSGGNAKRCTLTESQARLMYQRRVLDCGETSLTYAEWKAAGTVFGLDFRIGKGFWLDG